MYLFLWPIQASLHHSALSALTPQRCRTLRSEGVGYVSTAAALTAGPAVMYSSEGKPYPIAKIVAGLMR